jgi:hypothetical protein
MKLKGKILLFCVVLLVSVFNYNIAKADTVYVTSSECGTGYMGNVIVNLVGASSFSCTTDADTSQCTIEDIPSGTYTVTATKAGYILTDGDCNTISDFDITTNIITNLEVYLVPAAEPPAAAYTCPGNGCEENLGENMFNCPDDCLPEGVPTKSIPDVLEDIAKWLLGFAVMASVVILIWGGIYYVSSSGDEQKVQTAKKLVKYSLMGILVVGISYAVIYALDKIFTP